MSDQLLTAKEARQKLAAKMATLKNGNELVNFGTRQPNPEEHLFSQGDYEQFKLIAPPYDPTKLKRIVESSGKLKTCIDIYQNNIDGYGYEFKYLGDKASEKSDEVVAERDMLQGFFAKVNEGQSFQKLRKESRADYETTGNVYWEIVRYPTGDIATIYRCDPEFMRLQAKQDTPVPVKTELYRNGHTRSTTIYKRFRRYAMCVNALNKKIRWFKEWGDPRRMCAVTGKYEDELGRDEEIKEEASEIIHIKQGTETYGIPRWVGLASVVLGISSADYENYNLFETGAIPALAILVSGGYLTSESISDIENLLEGMKGKGNRHKVMILEAQGPNDTGEVGDRPTNAKVDFRQLPRPDDSEFQNYVKQGEQRIQACFRLPPLFSGEAESYSRSTSDSAKLITEEQLFKVERKEFDEVVNFTLMKELGAKYHSFYTSGPRLLEGQDTIDAIGKLARANALTTNQAIRLSNRILDLDSTTYESPWAEIPVASLFELLKKERVTQIEDVGMTPEQAEIVGKMEDTLKPDEVKKDIDQLGDNVDGIVDQLDQLYSLLMRTD